MMNRREWLWVIVLFLSWAAMMWVASVALGQTPTPTPTPWPTHTPRPTPTGPYPLQAARGDGVLSTINSGQMGTIGGNLRVSGTLRSLGNIYGGLEDQTAAGLLLYGDAGTGHPFVSLINPAGLDDVVDYYTIWPDGAQLNIGPVSDLDQFRFSTTGLEVIGDVIAGDAEFGAETATAASASNLVAGWHLDEAAGTLDNFEGTAAYDMEAKAGTTFGVDGVFDNALRFASASTQYASASSNLGLTGWPITITGWFKTSTKASASIFALNDISEANITYTLQTRVTGVVMGMRRNTTARYTYGQSNVCDGQWHHAVMVIAAKTATDDCKIYVDGVLEGVSTDSVEWAAGIDTAAIGVNLDSNPDSYFNGDIDEVAVYDAALTAAQIKALYAAGMSTRIADGAVSTQIVDASRVKAISFIATDDIVQKYGYGTDTTYPVPIMIDAVGYPHQAIYPIYCDDGSFTYTSDGFKRAFAAGCTPIVTLTPIINEDVPTTIYTVHLKTSTNTGFTYEVRKAELAGEPYCTDVTASVPVHGHVTGWLD